MMVGMSPHAALLKILLIVLLILPIVSGSLIHALLPHSHSANAVITGDMHSVFRHEEKQLFVFAYSVVFFVIAVVLVSVFFSRRALVLQGQLIRSQHKRSGALRRGTLPYRKFR